MTASGSNGTPEVIAAGTVARQEFGATEVQRSAETSSIALAEREKATIAAMFLVADGRRRSIAQFESGLLAECERPGFAEIARYKKPQRHRDPDSGEWVNGFIEGWSIRFAEAALRNWKNVFCDAKIVYEDAEKRIIRFMLIDLESNLPLSNEIQLSKTVERRGTGRNQADPPKGRDILAERVNVAGQKVFIVAATDDELYMKQAAAYSKFRRNALTFMPGDILDAALHQIKKTLDGQSPEAARDRLVMGFDQLKVTVLDLQEYLGHSISEISAEEISELRGVYTALKTEESTWASIMDGKRPSGSVAAAHAVAEEKIRQISEDKAAGIDKKPEVEVPAHIRDILSYRDKIGVGPWVRTLKNHNYATVEEVTAENFMAVAADMEDLYKAQQKAAPAEKTESADSPKPAAPADKPKFGTFGGKK